MKRIDGWEARLIAVVEAARHRPYVLGEHDCLRFSCACIEAMTGNDYWPNFAGYKTKRQARRVIAVIAPSLGHAVSLTLGRHPRVPRSAQRGDLVRFHDGEDHLGVCLGGIVAVLGEQGLQFIDLNDGRMTDSWRIG